MNKHNLALLKVHGTAVLFGASGIFGALIQSGADTLVLGRVLIAFGILILYFLYKMFCETPTLKMFIGGAIILLSVAWSNLKK